MSKVLAPLIRLEVAKVENLKDPSMPWVLRWQSNIMPAPSFWYYQTEEKAREAETWFRQSRGMARITKTEREAWEREVTEQVTPAYGTAPRCPSTLAPEHPAVRCVLPEGHEGSHQDHILPIRRWT